MVIGLRNSDCNKVLVDIMLTPRTGQAASPLTKTNQLSRIGEFSRSQEVFIDLFKGKEARIASSAVC